MGCMVDHPDPGLFTPAFVIFLASKKGGGDHWTRPEMTRMMRKVCDAAKIPRMVFHELRHTYASILVNAGAPYYRSRKILRVAVTRAKVHTLLLGPIFPDCPILAGHKL